MRTAKNILMHEFIGLQCTIIGSKNKHHIGTEGKIINETMKTIILKTKTGKKSIIKKDSVFRMDLGKQKVDVDGNYMAVRPEDRIKKKFKKW